uniref:Low-density lipoprotein receptor n=1 Tax=Angiostrongylus cantonensis TaxID=6313 RepID=A0A0K0CT19_ANGCA
MRSLSDITISACDGNETFTCNNGRCIPRSWRCDGDIDCKDKEDEQNCTVDGQIQCGPEEFHCAKDHPAPAFKTAHQTCIPSRWVCDGEFDCEDRSDERDCPGWFGFIRQFSPYFYLYCGTLDVPVWCLKQAPSVFGRGRRRECCYFISTRTLVYGDLYNPLDLSFFADVHCTENQFTCSEFDGKFKLCIPKSWQCDGQMDCASGADEENCAKRKCEDNDFQCANGICIFKNWECDGEDDCGDRSDESNCTSTPQQICDSKLMFKCVSSDGCISKDWVCDGEADCLDHSDERNCSDTPHECAHPETEFACASGRYCINRMWYCDGEEDCPDGSDERNCASSRECVKGERSCPGSNLCISDSQWATIRQFDLVTNVHVPLIQSPGSAVAMDFHLRNGTLVWSDIALQKILMCKIGNDSVHHHLAVREKCAEGEQHVLLESNVHTPDGLAVDWVHNLLFWTDGGLDQVNVMDLETRRTRTLFSDGLEEPRAIAVDPEMGLIFWTDWGKEARIERAGMDGQHRTVIVKGERVKWPNGLALDYIDKRVYWADAKIKSIFSCDYWGRDIKVVLHSHQYLRHPFSIAVFEDRIYYTDWEHDGVITINKFTGGEMRTVMQKVSTPMTVRIYHKLAQPKLPNKCDNSGCNEMCLPRAVYRKTEPALETDWHDRPYACMCQGNTPTDLIECAEMAIDDYIEGLVYYRKRHYNGSFTALNFDNPIYRRTTEPDMDDPFRDPFTDNSGVQIGPGNARLVLANPEDNIHNSVVSPFVLFFTTV